MTGGPGSEDSRSPEPDPARPVLRVVRGGLADDELAALVAVVSARLVGATEKATAVQTRQAGWAGRGPLLRTDLRPGPRQWSLSGRTPGARTRATW